MSTSSTKQPLRAANAGAVCRDPRLEQTIDRLVAEGYPKTVVRRLTSAGEVGGHRLAGSPGDLAAADYVAAELRAIGLEHVRQEQIAVDVWDTRGANVLVEGTSIRASQWAGVPGTPPDGITAALVYARGGEADDFAAAGEVAGRIVLVDLRPSAHWIDIVGMEALEREVAGMIVTSTRTDTAQFSGRDLLAATNATYCTGAPPFVYVSRRDGDLLKRRAAAGPVVVTMLSRVEVTTIEDGGRACNVVAELPGRAGRDDLVIVGAHHDAYFEGAIDNASGVAGLLLLAKAMLQGGARPERTVVFVSHSAEEFGLADSPYDWCIGSWRLLQAHPEWPGRVSAELEIDEIGYYQQPLWALNSPELGPWLRGTIDRPRARIWPQDCVTSFSDQWAYTAMGIPSIHFGNATDAYDRGLNHTDHDTHRLLDYTTLGRQMKTIASVAAGLGVVAEDVLPLDLRVRAADLIAGGRADELIRAYCSGGLIRRYRRALDAFSSAAEAQAARRVTLVSGEDRTAFNRGLLECVARLNRSLAALDRRDDRPYPHLTQLREVLRLEAARERCLQHDLSGALDALAAVSLTSLGRRFSPGAYRRFLDRLSPAYGRLGWGLWGRLPRYVDVLPEYRAVESGCFEEALGGLGQKRAEGLAELEARLTEVSDALVLAAEELDRPA